MGKESTHRKLLGRHMMLPWARIKRLESSQLAGRCAKAYCKYVKLTKREQDTTPFKKKI